MALKIQTDIPSLIPGAHALCANPLFDVQIMKLSKLLQLKGLLQTATDLSEPSRFFWAHLANDRSFMSAGKVRANPRLQVIIERAATDALGSEQAATMLMLLRIPKYKFWHGSCYFSGLMAQIIYFDDIDKGLLTIVENVSTGMTRYVRISAVEVDVPGGAVPVNPRNKPSA